jgi:transposase
MYYVGSDLHKLTCWFYVIDESGNRIISKSIPNSTHELHNFFNRIPKPFVVAVESTYNWYFFVDIAEEYAERVYLANSYELKAFAKRNKKTDKIDAKLIADILRKGFIPNVFIPDRKTRMTRELLRYRINIVTDRSRNISRLKALLDKLGLDSSGKFTTYEGLKKAPLESLPENYRDIAAGYIERIASLIKKERDSGKLVEENAREDSDIRNLIGMPGVSYFSATLIKSEIADIERFASFGRLCAYAGLSPRVSQSGNKCIHGPLNKNRRKYLRWILLEIVHCYIKADPSRIRKFNRIKRKKGYNTAKVVFAREMLKIIYHILKERRPYCEKVPKSGLRRFTRSKGSEGSCLCETASMELISGKSPSNIIMQA